jgi:hypothetical protein
VVGLGGAGATGGAAGVGDAECGGLERAEVRETEYALDGHDCCVIQMQPGRAGREDAKARRAARNMSR